MEKNKIDIKKLMGTKQDILSNKLSILLSHPVTKGEHCESAWIDFFRSFLPSKYAVDKGFVFDAEGTISDQIDIIIYDALYAPLIFGTDAGEKFVTAESVYAVFESKPEINKKTLEYADKKISSVKELKRSSRGVINAGIPQKKGKLTPIIGGILAINSIGLASIKSHIKSFGNIDIGCAIEKHSFLVKKEDDGSTIVGSTQKKEEVILAFFYMMLDELYQLGTVAGIEIREYANATLEGYKFKIENN